ncbi:MAG: AI-2E family transporter [Lachnospiraceae bacterium]|nr:AI-2E family transporter [Lachnospiraceae bacterium]
MNKSNFEWAKWVPITIIAILLMILYKTFDNLSQITIAIGKFLSVLSPLLFGILFSYFLYTPFKKVNKRFGKSKFKFIAKRKKFFSVTTIFLLLALIIVFIALVIAPILIASLLDLANSIPSYVNSLIVFIERLDDDTYWATLNISESIAGFVDDAISQYFNFALMEQLTRGVLGIAGGLANIVLGLIITLYILADLENIAAFFKRLSIAVIKNVKYRERAYKYLRQVNTVLFTFISSKGLDSIINVVVVTAILLIFNVPFAFLFGFIAGVFNFIPYLGSLIAMTFISLINIITAGPAKALQVLIALLIFQQIDANYIEPKIMNTSLKISPIIVIVSVIAAGAYFGIAGMFLAVPIVTIIKQIMIEYMDHHVKN